MMQTSPTLSLPGGNTVSPPLGLMALAAYARRARPGLDTFRLVDEHTQAWSPAQWLASGGDPQRVVDEAEGLELW